MSDNNQKSVKELFEGKNGTVLFWIVVALGIVFIVKMLPSLINLGFYILIFGVIVYFLFRFLKK